MCCKVKESVVFFGHGFFCIAWVPLWDCTSKGVVFVVTVLVQVCLYIIAHTRVCVAEAGNPWLSFRLW